MQSHARQIRQDQSEPVAPFRFLGEMLGIAVAPAFARRDNMLAFSDNEGGWVSGFVNASREGAAPFGWPQLPPAHDAVWPTPTGTC